MISPPNEIHKNWVLFPEKINGKYAILHSFYPKILIDYFDTLDELDGTKFIKSDNTRPVDKTRDWDSWFRGVGPSPIKTELGKRIREAFVPEAGCVIMAADYSQVELRIMAHLSEDPVLVASFAKGEDVHTRTASEVFGIFPQMVTEQMRREAKVINFGIIYGMSAFGLSKELNISPKLAKVYIDGYFNKYRGVREYIDKLIEGAREKGYVTTLMERRCYIPDIKSSNVNQRQFAERLAVNAPIQGTAADIIKVAMVSIARRLKAEGLRSKMIMQVHDELVFEVPKGEVDTVKALVAKEMEGVLELKAPLKVDIGVGNNWAEAH